MNIKKSIALLLAVLTLLTCVSCGKSDSEPEPVMPEEGQLKSICQLSVIEGYFHSVVKYKVEDAEKFLWMTKDKRFWVEYTGVANYGLDASKVTMDISGKEITVTLPKAKLLYCKVDSTSLDGNSAIVDKSSAKITAEDSKNALVEAQKELEEKASNHETLLTLAQQQAQQLMENYIKNIVSVSGKDSESYTINWVYLDEE